MESVLCGLIVGPDPAHHPFLELHGHARQLVGIIQVAIQELTPSLFARLSYQLNIRVDKTPMDICATQQHSFNLYSARR
jgi:hypothetical protein